MSRKRLQLILLLGPFLAGGALWGVSVAVGFSWYLLLWPALCLHQVEEYVVTERLLGEDYFLLNWLSDVGYRLTPGNVFFMDVCLGWVAAIAAGIVGETFVWLGLSVSLFFAWNGVWHLSLTSHLRKWSPGSLTGLLCYLPLAGFLCHRAHARALVGPISLAALVLGTWGAHHLFLGTFPKRAEDEGSD